MGKKLAIKGHPTRGNEVIKLLEMLGGKVDGSKGFDESAIYVISADNIVEARSKFEESTNNYAIFTLDDFYAKFPFKVGDAVCVEGLCAPINKMEWDPVSQEVRYLVSMVTAASTVTIKWYTVKELINWNAELLVNKEIIEEYTKQRNKRLLDQLYENGLKAMFKEHDIVTVVAKGGRSRWICEYKSAKADQLSYYRGTYVVTDDDYKEDLMYDSNYDINPFDTVRLATPGEVTLFERIVRKIEKPNILAELLDHIKTTSKEDLEKEFEEIKEWSNVGPTVEEFRAFCESVNRKPKYPTTYAECCKVLKKNPDIKPEVRMVSPEESLLFSKFIMLKRCRDAYWKIYGEKKGLDKPWDSTCGDWGYWIGYSINENKIYLQDSRILVNCVLVFPTEEMRDAFYVNFKNLIEQCKELL
jgi:hypothetical protein